MDINKDNEMLQGDVTEETEASEVTSEEIIKDESSEDYSTLSVTQEEIDEELTRYGIVDNEEEGSIPEEVQEEVKSKCFIQKPIIIAAAVFLAVAIIVCGAFFIYNAFLKPGISGVYILADEPDSAVYFVFDKDGNVSMDGGGVKYYGTYTMETVDGENILTSDFYFIGTMGGQAVVTFEGDTMTLTFADYGLDYVFEKTSLPELKLDPQNITHASADEVGITELYVDEGVVGTWTEDVYGTYTFNADGTGSYVSEYNYNQYYGYGMGTELEFTYTVYEDEILITVEYYDGYAEYDSWPYYLDKGNLVLNGTGFTKAEN